MLFQQRAAIGAKPNADIPFQSNDSASLVEPGDPPIEAKQVQRPKVQSTLTTQYGVEGPNRQLLDRIQKLEQFQFSCEQELLELNIKDQNRESQLL